MALSYFCPFDFLRPFTIILSLSAPHTADHYEKLVLATPNSSLVWVKFMSYWLSRSLVDNAREVAQRALKRIDPSKEKEKLNVWVALLNLEHTYGDKESTSTVLRDALQYNYPKPVYLAAIKMYLKSGDVKSEDKMYKALLSKYGTHKSVWVKRALCLFHRKHQSREARALLKRALAQLPSRKHVATISKFAQLEYKHGEVEIGRSLFEDLLNTYPKRTDIWGVYLDTETSTGDMTRIRSLYDRAIDIKANVKKTKQMFKKYLKFEQQHGDSKRVEYVKTKAREYVQSKQ